ncbi:hypothetical protein HXX76_005821 [Chlamydomonas incerta]|uniref:Phosphodiesterase n=1 Tax=Chlamydomonas incerta TaxID=51695 RepID=A0A835T1K2_CHLIN|nr:hypothetical protein HXX76_005821 [Chlamydomonas incerta]|eukprot:KAG2437154.1 hypothetical protein HXX76_005821 [Chlamydomonas incerta]
MRSTHKAPRRWSWLHDCWAGVISDVVGTLRVVREHPNIAIVPLLALGLILGVGIWGIHHVAAVAEDSAKNRASALAIDTAVWYRQQLSSASSSVVLMGAMVVHARGQHTAVQELFAGLAPALLSQTAANVTKMLEYVPNGVVRDIYPLTGNNAGAAGFNLFTAPGDRDGAVATVRDGAMTLVGPMKFFEGGYGVIVRVPVFVPDVDANETFGLPDPLDPYCGAPCAYNATTRTAFWGFSAGLVDLEAINAMPDSKPRMLQSMGYRYEIRALGIAEAELRVVAASERPPVDPVEAVISLPNTQWVVLVAPEDGWTDSSYAGLVAGVVVVAVVVAVLLFAALLSRHRHQMLLEALLPKQLIRDLHSNQQSLLGSHFLTAETTADMLLGLLGQLLENQMPSLQDVVYCRQAIIRRTEIYEPIALGQHIRNANLDADVTRLLMHQLGGGSGSGSDQGLALGAEAADDAAVQGPAGDDAPSLAAALAAARLQQHLGSLPEGDELRSGLAGGSGISRRVRSTELLPRSGSPIPADADFDSMQGALAAILAPQTGWLDAGPDNYDAASDAALPTAENEARAPGGEAQLGSCVGDAVLQSTCGPGAASMTGTGITGSMFTRAFSLTRGASLTSNTAPAAATAAMPSLASPVLGAGAQRQQQQQQQQPQPQPAVAVVAAVLDMFPAAAAAGAAGNALGAQTQPQSLQLRSSARKSTDAAETQHGHPRFISAVLSGSAGNGKPASPALLDSPKAVAAGPAQRASGAGGLPSPFAATDRRGSGSERGIISQMGLPGSIGPAGDGDGDADGDGEGDGDEDEGPIMGASTVMSAAAAAALLMDDGVMPLPDSAAAGLAGTAAAAAAAGAVSAPHPGTPRSAAGLVAPPDGLLDGGPGAAPGVTLGASFRRAGSQSRSTRSTTDIGVRLLPSSHTGRPSNLGGSSRPSLAGGVGGGVGLSAASANAALVAALARKQYALVTPTPPPPVIEEVEKVLAGADGWQFDTWRLRDVTNGHALSALGFFLIQRAGLIPRLKLKPAVLARLLRHLEAGYVDNPYHSATHAADVLQTLHVIIHGAQLHVHYLDPLGLFAAYWAAIVHDYGHPGLTNDFLINTSDPLAVRYNDRSPLENHHSAASFSAMRRPGLDVLAPLTTEQKTAFRKQVIDMVLATDMKQHFSLLSHFNTVHRLANFNKPPAATPGTATPVVRLTSNIATEFVVTAAGSVEDAPHPADDTQRLLGLQIAIKAADIGHLGESLEVHKRWLAGLEEEFFRQGDKEKALGIPISPLFDRAKQGVSKSQVGFYEFVALPLVHALAGAFPGTQPLKASFEANYRMYRRAAAAEEERGSAKQP